MYIYVKSNTIMYYSVPFTHKRNEAMTKKFVHIVKAENKEFPSKGIWSELLAYIVDIHMQCQFNYGFMPNYFFTEAAYTYYKSLGKEHRAKSSGKYDETVVTKRRRKRFNRVC